MNGDDRNSTETGDTGRVGTFAAVGKRRGRPPKDTDRLEPVNLSLPPSMIEQMRGEKAVLSLDSLSAVARLAISDYLRRVGKQRQAQAERGS